MAPRLTLCLLLVLLWVSGGVARAAEPPNPHDPCAKAGRDTCGTTGVGSYRTYSFGPRWFGDYRGAVPDVSGGTFCIDLRFWYPSKSYGYEEHTTDGLKNRAGKAISSAALRRMSYAVYNYGRTRSATNQSAVMLYVHSQVGDGAPGEVDPAALTASARSLYNRIAREAGRLAGPYTVKATVPDKLTAGEEATMTVEVDAASGARVPGVSVSLSGDGADDLPGRVTTGSSGAAKVAFAPNSDLELTVKASGLAADAPTLYVPTKGQSAANGQRLVSPASTTRSAQVSAPVQAKPALATRVSSQTAAPGDALTDTIDVTGLAGRSATIQAALYGPYATRDAVKCDDTPAWTGTVAAGGDGSYTTAAFTVQTPGYYTYRESIAESPQVAAVQTACADTAETTVVKATPTVTTAVSAQSSAPGAQITDSVIVSGLGKYSATVNVSLWGPFGSQDAIQCSGTPAWTGTLTANGDGSYTTQPFTLPSAGYYTYQESIAAAEGYDAVTSACADTAETTLAKATPQVTTAASDDVVKPGATLSDQVVVTGLGKTAATIDVALYGPYASRADIDCAGTPYWKGSLNASGDGTYTSPKATVKRVGFYVFRESIAGSDTVAAAQTDCAQEAETSLAAPLIITGRGDRVAQVRIAAAADTRPTQVSLAARGVNAKVYPVGIDMKAGALGVPSDIHKVGWWSDGASPGDAHGAVLLAGHVDSAKSGAGAFYGLKSARSGDVVSLTSADGTVRRYRVTTTKLVLKARLPADVYSKAGPARLVLVTCSGPFDARTGHYRDNLIVTAKPL